MTDVFAGLPRAHFTTMIIDPPWRFSGGVRATRPGWSSWGNEVGKFDEAAA